MLRLVALVAALCVPLAFIAPAPTLAGDVRAVAGAGLVPAASAATTNAADPGSATSVRLLPTTATAAPATVVTTAATAPEAPTSTPVSGLSRISYAASTVESSAAGSLPLESRSTGTVRSARGVAVLAATRSDTWHVERRITFYGPGGHYGRGMACGGTLTTHTMGVATWLYPCGTMISFQYQGRTITVPVVDRGPAAWTGFRFDLTGRACVTLVGSKGACWTIYNVKWKVVSKP